MSRQTQRSRGFWRRGKGSFSLTHWEVQHMPLIGDLDAVAWPGTAPTQGPHLLPPQGFRLLLAILSLYKPQTWSPVRAHPRLYEFTMDPQIWTQHSFCSQAISQTLKHIHIYAHTFASHSLNLRDTVSPLMGLLECLWEVIGLLFCLLKAGLFFEPRFLPAWQAGLPIGSWTFSRFLCATKTCPLVCQERGVPALDQ
jgi:hypothetical protein